MTARFEALDHDPMEIRKENAVDISESMIARALPMAPADVREYEKQTILTLVRGLTKKEKLLAMQIAALNLRYDEIIEAEEQELRA